MSDTETDIVRGWKRAIQGKFIGGRHLKKDSVLISMENSEVYIVKGIILHG